MSDQVPVRYKFDSDGAVTVPANLDLYRALEVAFDDLDPLDLRILRLVYFGRQTQEQVARRLLVPRKSVARAVSRAMTRVAQSLEG